MRYLGSALLAGVAATHILEARHEEAHYMVALFIALAAVSLVLAGALAAGIAERAAWATAALLCLAAMVGYVVSRTSGMPQMADDIGNWTEPLGIVALACEASLVVFAAAALARLHRSEAQAPANFRLSSRAAA